MNIFKVNDKITSYTYPLIKIAVAATIIIIRISGFPYDWGQGWLNTVVSVVTVMICLLGFFTCYISVVEILLLCERRAIVRKKSKDVNSFKSKDYVVADIVDMLRQNDIMEIVIKGQRSIVYIGASSDCDNTDSHFFDKLYYIDKKEYKTIEDFKEALDAYCRDDVLSVVSIDGIKQ